MPQTHRQLHIIHRWQPRTRQVMKISMKITNAGLTLTIVFPVTEAVILFFLHLSSSVILIIFVIMIIIIIIIIVVVSEIIISSSIIVSEIIIIIIRFRNFQVNQWDRLYETLRLIIIIFLFRSSPNCTKKKKIFLSSWIAGN